MPSFQALKISLQNNVLWQNSYYDYLMAFLLFLAIILALKVFQIFIVKRLVSLSEKTKNKLDDLLVNVISKIGLPFYVIIGLYFALKDLVVMDMIHTVVEVLFLIIIAYEIVQIVIKVFEYVLDNYLNKRARQEGSRVLTISMVRTLKFFVKLFLWAIAILMVLSNLGINVTSIVAGLGIGGIAVALAAQNILADIFSSFSLYFDRPFEVGDYITIGNDMGTVERIGLKTTRLRTLQGEELIISNQELTSVRVRNFKRMESRRAAVNLGVEYGLSLETLENIPKYLQEIVEKQENVDFGRCYFTQYNDSSLNFELVYFVNSSDYDDYLAANQAINLAIYKKFVKENIPFAYPTQTVYVKK